MTSDNAPRRLHVERTADPTVLSWVVHHPRLDAAPAGRRQVPVDSALGGLVADGSIIAVSVRHATVRVTGSDPARWQQVAPIVQAAVLSDLDQMEGATTHWLIDAIHPDTGPAASIAELQHVVDRAAGTVLTSHGGAMNVVSIDGDTVHLSSSGTCTGCHQSDDTVIGLITPALRAEFPGVTSVIVDSGPDSNPAEPAHAATQHIRFSDRLRRRDTFCH